jgi:hypothetical protein
MRHLLFLLVFLAQASLFSCSPETPRTIDLQPFSDFSLKEAAYLQRNIRKIYKDVVLKPAIRSKNHWKEQNGFCNGCKRKLIAKGWSLK